MNDIKKGIATFFISIALFVAGPAIAETQIEIDYDTSSFQHKKLMSGEVSVSVGYDKQENIDGESNNLHYQIFYNGTSQVNSSAFTSVSGGVSLKDLNSDGLAENKSKNFEVNGILAGYVAQKALLGEYQQGWEFMLANYDRTSDWGFFDPGLLFLPRKLGAHLRQRREDKIENEYANASQKKNEVVVHSLLSTLAEVPRSPTSFGNTQNQTSFRCKVGRSASRCLSYRSDRNIGVGHGKVG